MEGSSALCGLEATKADFKEGTCRAAWTGVYRTNSRRLVSMKSPHAIVAPAGPPNTRH
jgi:hypothetical protein